MTVGDAGLRATNGLGAAVALLAGRRASKQCLVRRCSALCFSDGRHCDREKDRQRAKNQAPRTDHFCAPPSENVGLSPTNMTHLAFSARSPQSSQLLSCHKPSYQNGLGVSTTPSGHIPAIDTQRGSPASAF